MSSYITDAVMKQSSKAISISDIVSDTFSEVKRPAGMYDFRCIIQTPEVVIKNIAENGLPSYDFEFEIPFDDDLIANEAEIRIYNLSESTKNKFAIGNSIDITAGYGDDMGIILHGWISNVQTECSGADITTVIYVLDTIAYDAEQTVNKSYTAGTLASQILSDLINMTGLEIAEYELQRDYTYKNDTKVSGAIMDCIKNYADVCGVSVFISQQKIYCKPIWLGWNTYFTICPETGMIESPERFTESNQSEIYEDIFYGYNVSMLLQHRMQTGAIVGVNSKVCSGDFRVVGGKHIFDGLSATTELKIMDRIDVIIHPEDEDDEEQNISPTGYTCTKYELSEEQKVNLAKYVNREAGDNNDGKRAIASHMCNMYEYWRWSNDDRAKKTLYQTIYGNRWYAQSTRNNQTYTSEDLNAVEDCICNGNRNLPPYVNEFDMWGGVAHLGDRNYTDIVSIYPNPTSDGDLQRHISVLKNGMGASGKFYTVYMYSDYGGNIFYYESDKYKEYCDSKYISAASSLAQKFVSVAVAEEGTAETGNNKQKYGREMGADGYPWCGYFVAWCAKHADVPTSVIAWNNDSCGSALWYAYAAEKKGIGTYHEKGSGYKPKIGDIFVQNYNGTDYAEKGHVGIVRSYESGDYFKSIEGNSSDKVNSRSLSIHQYTFVTPNWEAS